MTEARMPSNISLNDGRTLQQALDQHETWLKTGKTTQDSRRLALESEYLHSVDLEFCNLSRAKFTSCNMFSARITGSNFTGATLNACDMRAIEGERPIFVGASFATTKMDHASLNRAQFNTATIFNSSLRDSKITESSFRSSDIRSTSFYNAKVSDTDFSCTLNNVDLMYGSFKDVSFADSEITSCDMSKAVFLSCDFSRSKVSHTLAADTFMSDTAVVGSAFTFSELTSARFSGMNFRETDFTGSTLKSVDLKDCKNLVIDPATGEAEISATASKQTLDDKLALAADSVFHVTVFLRQNLSHFSPPDKVKYLGMALSLGDDSADVLSLNVRSAIKQVRERTAGRQKSSAAER
jgi:uncharacterized protein YjbI with pentapeptide repeats